MRVKKGIGFLVMSWHTQIWVMIIIHSLLNLISKYIMNSLVNLIEDPSQNYGAHIAKGRIWQLMICSMLPSLVWMNLVPILKEPNYRRIYRKIQIKLIFNNKLIKQGSQMRSFQRILYSLYKTCKTYKFWSLCKITSCKAKMRS